MKKSHLLLTAIVWPCLFFASTLVSVATHSETITAVTETTPYTFLKGERIAGPATEVVEKTLQAAGLTDYQLKLYPWARAYDMALKEPGVLIYLIARTPVREQQFQWAGEIMKIQYHLYRLRARTNIQVKTLADAKNYTIGVMRDDVRQQYLQTKGFFRLAMSAQSIDNFNKLINGQVDLVPLTEDDANSLCLQAHFDCAGLERVLTLDEASSGLYMAYSTSTQASIVQKTRAAFDKLKADGTVRRIMEKKP
ncbi:MAG TPA: transporter substrate-binding domain-containing protein [Rhodoferax sp.]